MPTVSIVIPTHNRAAYLQRALQSVLDQTFGDFEVIVVDDGSTDETARVMGALADSRIQLVQQVQQERAAARNAGLAHARGEFIAFLDDDDVWLPPLLERAQRAFDTNKVEVVYTGWRYIDAREQILPQAPYHPQKRGAVLRDLLNECWFPTSAALVRRTSLARVGGFDRALVPVEDWDLWIRLAAPGDEFNFVAEPLLHYRLHDQNSRHAWELAEMRAHQLLDQTFVRLGAAFADARLEAFARLDFRSATKYFGSAQIELGSELFARAVSALPSLLDELPTYYQVICAMQPNGYKGTNERLDLALGREYIEHALTVTFAADAALPARRARAYANAYFTLAQLYYGRREMAAARRYFKMAVQMNPTLLARAGVPLTWSKTFLPASMIDFFRTRRGSYLAR